MVVTEMTTDLKTRCVGRYLIDLPANVVPRGWVRLHGVIVESESKTLRQFQRDMDARGAELRTIESPAGYQYLYEDGNVRGIEHTRYFISLGSRFSSDANRAIEAYKWDRGYQIRASQKATDWTNSKYRDMPIIKNDPNKNDVPQKTRLVFDLIEKLQGRPEDVIPTQPGACFLGGFLPGKALSEKEEIESLFILPDKPDVYFKLHSFANMRPEKTLLQRVNGSAMRDVFKATDGRLIRSGSIDLPEGVKAEEALMAVTTTASLPVQGHLFSLEANYSGGALTPYLLLDMMNGYPNSLAQSDEIEKASLTEGEAIALWDAVSRTLRPRPNAF